MPTVNLNVIGWLRQSLGAAPDQINLGRRRSEPTAFGLAGSQGQPQTQAALFTRYARFKQELQAAVTAPRWLLGRTWGATSTNLKLESRFAPGVIEAMRRAGHDVEIVSSFNIDILTSSVPSNKVVMSLHQRRYHEAYRPAGSKSAVL